MAKRFKSKRRWTDSNGPKQLTPEQAQLILSMAEDDENDKVQALNEKIGNDWVLAVDAAYLRDLLNIKDGQSLLFLQERLDGDANWTLLKEAEVRTVAAKAETVGAAEGFVEAAKKPDSDVPALRGDIKRRIKRGLSQTKLRLRALFLEQIPAISNASEGGDAQLFKELYDEAIKSVRVLGLDDNVALDFIEKESALPCKHPEIEVLNQIKRLTEAAAEKEKMLERDETPEVIQMAMSWKLDIPAEKISGVETFGRVRGSGKKGVEMVE